jgi:hypothetical protein
MRVLKATDDVQRARSKWLPRAGAASVRAQYLIAKGIERTGKAFHCHPQAESSRSARLPFPGRVGPGFSDNLCSGLNPKAAFECLDPRGAWEVPQISYEIPFHWHNQTGGLGHGGRLPGVRPALRLVPRSIRKN